MKIEDLRVGNYAIDPRPFNKDTKEFFNIREDGVFKVKLSDLYYAELMKPIELTPEILEKCGYKVQCDYFFFKKDEPIAIEKMHSYYAVKIKVAGQNSVKITLIRYLHELQNIFFALKGQELEINL